MDKCVSKTSLEIRSRWIWRDEYWKRNRAVTPRHSLCGLPFWMKIELLKVQSPSCFSSPTFVCFIFQNFLETPLMGKWHYFWTNLRISSMSLHALGCAGYISVGGSRVRPTTAPPGVFLGQFQPVGSRNHPPVEEWLVYSPPPCLFHILRLP